MLKKRLAASLVVKNGHVVQSIQYRKFLPVGTPEVTVEFLSSWGVDEILYLDIDVSKEKRTPNFDALRRASQKCFVPLIYGGGIRTTEHIRQAIHTGADKVSMNAVLLDAPKILAEVMPIFGAQCLIAAIDLIDVNGSMRVFDHRKVSPVDMEPLSYIEKLVRLGAGEVFLSFVHRNGMKVGLEVDFVKRVRKLVSVPIIVGGGTGHPEHVRRCFSEADASCVAVGNTFHFSEHTVQTFKSYLAKHEVQLRQDSKANYDGFEFDDRGRISKLPDAALRELRFEIIRNEKI